MQNSINQISAGITTLESDKKAFIRAVELKTFSDITSTNEQLMQSRQEGIKIAQVAKGVTVSSPVDGVILDLPAISEGAIVREGDKILTLVQTNEPLYLGNRHQSKRHQRSTGWIAHFGKNRRNALSEIWRYKGEVIFVSQDTFPESLAGEKGFFYRGRIKNSL